MSFSSEIKNEIASCAEDARHCNIAEIAAIINLCGHVVICNKLINIKVQTENIIVAKKYFSLLNNTFNIHAEVSLKKNYPLRSNSIYLILVKDNLIAQKIFTSTGLIVKNNSKLYISNKIEDIVIKKICCKRAYIKGAFLACGSISDPYKTYHLEFASVSYQHIEDLQKLIAYFDIEAKIIQRKGHYILYLKEADKIVDLLNVMGAYISLMNLENLRILKDMRNNVNRKVNCETANLNKTVCASVKQVEDIKYIQDTIGLDSLPDALKEIAIKRLMFQDLTLKELGQKLIPTVGKSGVNHRLKKISSIAETIKYNREAYHV